MTRKRKWVLRNALALVVLFLALAVVAFFLPQKLLCVDSGPVKADVIVVLGGGTGSRERPERAVELLNAGEALRVIVSGVGDDEINRRVLITSGIHARAIELESQSRTTKENAEFTIKLLRAENLHHVILVTSWYHSRRALETFLHYAPDIQFYSRPSYFAFDHADWDHKNIEHRIYLEYPKLLGYWLRYGICPL